jgi:hypothetical protein
VPCGLYFILELGSCSVAQAGLEVLGSAILVLRLLSAGITDAHHLPGFMHSLK